MFGFGAFNYPYPLKVFVHSEELRFGMSGDRIIEKLTAKTKPKKSFGWGVRFRV